MSDPVMTKLEALSYPSKKEHGMEEGEETGNESDITRANVKVGTLLGMGVGSKPSSGISPTLVMRPYFSTQYLKPL